MSAEDKTAQQKEKEEVTILQNTTKRKERRRSLICRRRQRLKINISRKIVEDNKRKEKKERKEKTSDLQEETKTDWGGEAQPMAQYAHPSCACSHNTQYKIQDTICNTRYNTQYKICPPYLCSHNTQYKIHNTLYAHPNCVPTIQSTIYIVRHNTRQITQTIHSIT